MGTRVPIDRMALPRMRDHRITQHRPKRLGPVLAHVFEHEQLRPRNQRCCAFAAAGRDEGVVQAADHQRRHFEPFEAFGA